MCGILGVTGKSQPTRSQIDKAIALIANRGPDHQDMVNIGTVACFGHTRLSIIDLSAAGNQPFQFEHLTLTFNGMIYNHHALREELRGHGYEFSSSSDTEVLIKAWHCWGQNALQKFDGFFAFAIYDREENSLHLYRDHIGKKPLYWRHWGDGIAFASRLDAVEALSQQEALRKDAVPWLFYLKYIPAPMSAVDNIFKLEAGHHLHFRNGNTMIRRWAKTFGLHDDGIRPTTTSAEDVKTAIVNAVKKRLDADVPVSTLLSGGLDSSIVTCIAAKMTKLDSFTLAIRSDGNVLQFDESGIAAKTAQILGTRHHTIMLEEADALSSIDRLFSQVFDEPFADPASVLNHLIFKALSAHSKVCLTGDGGDELFGGYRRHQGHLLAHQPLANNILMRMMARLFGPILPDLRDTPILERLRLLRRYLMALDYAKSDGRSWLTREDVGADFFSITTDHRERFADYRHDAGRNMDPINALLSLEMIWTIPGQMMVKNDRTSMDVGVEVRSPLLDHNVIETAFCLDGRQKLQRNNGKAILRKMFRDELPQHIFNEPKRGFEMPLKSWLAGPFAHYLDVVTAPDFLNAVGLRQEVVRSWVDALHSRNATTAANHLWSLIGLKAWMDGR